MSIWTWSSHAVAPAGSVWSKPHGRGFGFSVFRQRCTLNSSQLRSEADLSTASSNSPLIPNRRYLDALPHVSLTRAIRRTNKDSRVRAMPTRPSTCTRAHTEHSISVS